MDGYSANQDSPIVYYSIEWKVDVNNGTVSLWEAFLGSSSGFPVRCFPQGTCLPMCLP
jgi:hypothetical protein